METLSIPRSSGEQQMREPVPSGRNREETVSTAEAAECTCPDFCERDHTNE